MIETKKVLILGSLGMLGQELVRVFSDNEQYTVTAWDREDIDATNSAMLEKRLLEMKPAIVLNAVAYNAVDRCEEDDAEFQKALILNRDVPAKLSELSVILGFLLVHYSTDYVFDGANQTGYDEAFLPNPLSRYGESKYAGERAVREQAKQYYLIRLSKLFGNPGKSAEAKRSFFAVMLEQALVKKEVSVVDDEKSCFTYAPDLALATRELVESKSEFGMYHLTNEGSVTWYQAVQELYRLAKKEVSVLPVSSDTFPRPAKRPSVSTLLNTKRPKLRHYTDALQEFLQE